MSHELTIPEQVEKVLAFAETKAKVRALVEESTHITTITNTAAYQQCHAARMGLKNARIAIEKTGKVARDEAVKFQKEVIAKEKELIAMIRPEENRLGELQDAVDKAKEREKAAVAEAERLRLEAIRARFDALKHLPLQAVGKPVAGISELIRCAEAMDGQFDDAINSDAFRYERSIVIAALKAAEDRQFMADAEAAKILAERAELERLKAEHAAIIAERERLAHEEHERLAANNRAEREACEAAARAAREEEQNRIDAERAERRRIEDEAAEKERERLRKERASAAAEREELQRAEIANADLLTSANDAVTFLHQLGHGKHLVTLKLEAACKRAMPMRKVA